MSRDKYSEKARSGARINGQTWTGKQLKRDGRAIDQLIAATLSETGLDATKSPAEYVRATNIQAERLVAGKFKTRASVEEIAEGKGLWSEFVRQKQSELSASEEESTNDSNARFNKPNPAS